MLGQGNLPLHFHQQPQQNLFCPKHNEPIKGLCFFNGRCDDRLLCRSCRRTHDSNHLNYYEELEDLKKDNLVRDLKFNLENILNVITTQNNTYENNSNYIISQINYFYKEIETNILQKLTQTREMLAENTSKKLEKNNALKQELIASLDGMTRAYDKAIMCQFNPPSTAEEMVQAICKAQVLRDQIESDPDLQYKETINFSITRLATTISGSLFQQVKLSLDQIYQDIANSFALDIATNLPSVTKGKLLPTPNRRKSPYGKLVEEDNGAGQGSEEQRCTPQKILEIFKSVNQEGTGRSSRKKTNEKVNPMDISPEGKDVEKASKLLRDFLDKKERSRSRSKGEPSGSRRKGNRVIEYQNEALTSHKQIMIGGLTYLAGKQELATAGADGSIQILSMKNLETLHSFQAHDSEIMRLMYVPDKELLLSAGVDGKINVWDYKHKCKLLHSFSRHRGVVYALEYLPETDLIISGGEDEYIRMWNVNTCREHHYMKTANSKIGSICRLENTKKIAVGFDKGHINIIVIGQTKKVAYSLKAHNGYVLNLGYLENQKLLVSGSDDGFLKIWKLSETRGDCVRRLSHENTLVRSFVLFPEKDLIVGNYSDKHLRVWKISTGKKVDDYEDKTFGESITAVYDNDEIVTANMNQIKQWAVNASLLE